MNRGHQAICLKSSDYGYFIWIFKPSKKQNAKKVMKIAKNKGKTPVLIPQS